MKQAGESRILYNGAILRRNGPAWRAEINRVGGRVRFQNRDLRKVKAWVDSTLPDILSGEAPLTPNQAAEYRSAIKRLPSGTSLLDAVSGYLSNRTTAPLGDKPLSEAVERFLADKRDSGLRVRTLNTLKWSLRQMDGLMAKPVLDIRLEDLLPLLSGLGPVTRNNHRRAWRTFFRWCMSAGYTMADPTKAISRARYDERLPGIFTVPQAAALLSAGEAVDGGSMAAYLAIGLFAGLRTASLFKIKWENIGEAIHVRPEADKLRSARHIEIQPNLAAWIKKYRRNGPVCPYGQERAFKLLRQIRARAGVEWPRNAMRHSYGSYLLARTKDSARVAHEMGHGSTDMLFRHYRALVTEDEARAYWGLVPENVSKICPSRPNGGTSSKSPRRQKRAKTL